MTHYPQQYPQPKIHIQPDLGNFQEKVMVEFTCKEHFDQFCQELVNKGKEQGLENALQILQKDARTLFKNIFGVEIK